MVNVKDQVYDAICSVEEPDKLVTDMYPRDWEKKYQVQYCEEQNSVYEWTDDQEQKSRLRYKLHVWGPKTLNSFVCAVDEKVSALGLRRTSCRDVEDPSGRRHKEMVYEGIIDCESEHVYWEI